jgi:hypothetical protein
MFREWFENWVKMQPYFGYEEADPALLERDEEGYADATVHAAWMGFVAREKAFIEAALTMHPANYELPDALSGNDWMKLRDWFADPARKRANSAFTAGAARDAATAFEASKL